MYNRAMQTLYSFALEPVVEVKGDDNSFDFRKGRSAKEVCDQIFCVPTRKCSPEWVLEGNIKGYFAHDWLIENIPINKKIMKQFLKSGSIYKDTVLPMETGTPQGGVISGFYTNMTLDWLEN